MGTTAIETRSVTLDGIVIRSVVAVLFVTAACSSSSSSSTPDSGPAMEPDASSDGAGRGDAQQDAAHDAVGDVPPEATNCMVELTPPIGTYTTSKTISDCTCSGSDTSCNVPLQLEATNVFTLSGTDQQVELNFQPANGTSFASIATGLNYTTVLGSANPMCPALITLNSTCMTCGGGLNSPIPNPIDAVAEVWSDFGAAPPGDTKYIYVVAVWGWPSGTQTVTYDAYNPVPIVARKVCK